MKANNNTKLREALETIVEYAKCASCHSTDVHITTYLMEMIAKGKAALAAPPRNFNIFLDHEEAWVAYKRIAPNGGYFDAVTLWDFIKWLFAETEVGSDGKQ